MRSIVGGSRRRRARQVTAMAVALVLSLLGGAMVLLFSDKSAQPPAALEPVQRTPEPAPETTEPAEPESDSSASDPFGVLGSGSPDAGGTTTDASALLSQGGLSSGDSAASLPSLPSGAAPPLPELPPLQLPPMPQLPAAPTIDWQAALQPYIQSQIDNAAANMATSITGTVVGSTAAAVNSAAVAVGDLILYAAYVNNGQAALSQLQSAAPALQASLATLPPPPDLSGLSAAFAAAAAQPPLGVPSPPPGLPGLPTPEQFAAALAVPAVGLPALAIPALPPPPPIGLPPFQLPPPPPIGLPPFQLPPPPPIGLPSFQLPSITRLLGLPF